MKKSYIILLLLFSFTLFYSCKEEDSDVEEIEEEIVDENEEEEEEQDTTYYGVVNWESDFPQLRAGTATADFLLQTEEIANIYYLITSTEVNFNSDSLLVDISTSTEEIDSITILSKGLQEEINPSDTLKINLENLELGITYHAYAITQNPNDSTLQNSISVYNFSLTERQQIFTFTSEAESREVLYLGYQMDEGLKYPEKKYPAIFHMGGNGETADQGEINIIRNGSLAQYIDKGNDVPMYVFSPQHIRNNWNTAMINEMVEEALSQYPIDENRLYFSGMSGGGIATWNYATDYPDVPAAIIPISGDGRDNKACDIKDIPVWAFHNSSDGIVSPNGSINMINAIEACDPAPAVDPLLTLFNDGGHNAWRRVYDPTHPDWDNKDSGVEPVDIYSWFLQYSKD
ncbi:hypothetical protein GCM10027429_32550 [Marivirga atlantica]|jgi:hypothetical protein|uniref:Uncharacterized protein n=1 Tax=Marivirga atlantica TaxID=1548457 RepID=A0A937DG55_9BACT|nr:hypothetical protein [Marivirga atlantica]MBL0766832.1 hypothetical protein [Marivirga atlantica]